MNAYLHSSPIFLFFFYFESLPPTKFSSCFRKCPSNIFIFLFLCIFIVWFYKEDFIAIELPSGIDLYSSNIFTWKTKGTKMQIGKVFFYSVHIFYVKCALWKYRNVSQKVSLPILDCDIWFDWQLCRFLANANLFMILRIL